MEKSKRKNYGIWILRIALSLACALTFAWIFSNSLKTGEQSSAQSLAVTNAVQDTARIIAPSSSVATATGAEYDKLHSLIRSIAHFSEFALLGALLIACYFSYTRDKSLCVLPLGLIVLTPIIDECLQISTGGRGAEMKDIFLDTAGGFLGAFAGLIIVGLILLIVKKRGAKRERKI